MSFGAAKEDRLYEEVTDLEKLRNIMQEVKIFLALLSKGPIVFN